MNAASVIPYGVDHWSMADLAAGAVPLVTIDQDSREPLRFYQHRSADGLPSSDPPDQVIIAALKRLCRPYDRFSATFLDRCGDYLWGVLAKNRPALERKLAPFDGLYSVEDWFFSAPLPLPRAFLFAPVSAGQPLHDERDFVQVEFAFFPGGRPVAALLQDGRLTPAKARERGARLASHGIVTVDVRREDLSSPAIFERIVPPDAMLGSLGVLPVGPGRPVRFSRVITPLRQ